MESQDSVDRVDDLPIYAPPGHTDTRNVRLVSREQSERFEMVHGTIDPGGEAAFHNHDVAYQAIFVIGGSAEVVLGQAAPQKCAPGSIIRIPPGTAHYVKSVGETPLQMVIVYSPPLNGDGN